MAEPTYVIMPILAAPALTEAAIADVLVQSVPIRLLLINQGVDDAFRDRLERIAEQESERVLLWSHQPPLPSLSASWNRALDFVWACGGQEALVVNNDVSIPRQTVEFLRKALHREHALFVTAVGVTKEQYDPMRVFSHYDFWDAHSDGEHAGYLLKRGGPDFSCYMISRECHGQFRFDEAFIPAFCEDLDTHRRIMLAGEGQRIFSIDMPYLHYASQTLKTLDPKVAQAVRTQIDQQSRAHYARKWGGGCNAETFWTPFDRIDAGSLPWVRHIESLHDAGIAPTTAALFDRERSIWRQDHA